MTLGSGSCTAWRSWSLALEVCRAIVLVRRGSKPIALKRCKSAILRSLSARSSSVSETSQTPGRSSLDVVRGLKTCGRRYARSWIRMLSPVRIFSGANIQTPSKEQMFWSSRVDMKVAVSCGRRPISLPERVVKRTNMCCLVCFDGMGKRDGGAESFCFKVDWFDFEERDGLEGLGG